MFGNMFGVIEIVEISGDLTINGNLDVNGDLNTSGQIEHTDNVIIINEGETGAGVTAGIAGIEIDRGTETNYRFIYDETDDLFKIGEIGSLQTVATRGNLTSGRVAFADSTNTRYDESGLLHWDNVASNLGIGINAPVNRAHLHKAAASSTYLKVTNTVTGATGNDGLDVGVNSSGEAILLNRENTNFRLYTNNAQRVVVTNSGVVQALGNIPATSTTSGTVVVTGGMGVTGDIHSENLISTSLDVGTGISESGQIVINEIAAPALSGAGEAKLYMDSTSKEVRVSVDGLPFVSIGTGDVSKVGTPVDNQVAIWTGDGTVEGDADLTFDGSSLAIGGVTPQRKLHLHQSDSALNYMKFTNSTTGSGVNDGFDFGIASSEDVVLINTEATHMRFFTSNTERFRITSGGEFGFGITSTNYKAQFHTSDSDNSIMQFTNSTTGTGSADGFLVGINSAEEAILTNRENTPMSFRTNNTIRMIIEGGGDVGINNNDPSFQLDVGGIMNCTGVYENGLPFTNTSLWDQNTAGDAVTPAATWDDYVGVGITAPERRFHMHQPSAVPNYLKITNTSTGAGVSQGIDLGVTGSGDAVFYNRNNTDMRFRTNDIDRFKIENDGGINFPSNTTAAVSASGTGSIRYNNTAGEFQQSKNGGAWEALGGGGGGTFLSLTDTPSSYTDTRIPFMRASDLGVDPGFSYNDDNQTLQIGENVPTPEGVGIQAMFYADNTGASYIKFGNDTTGIESGEGAYVGYAGSLEFVIQNYQQTDLSFWGDSGSGIDRILILHNDGRVQADAALNATGSATGSLTSNGGLSVDLDTWMGGDLSIDSATASTGSGTGCLTTVGGVGIGGDLYVDDILEVEGTSQATSGTTGAIRTAGGLGVAKDIYCAGDMQIEERMGVGITTGAAAEAGIKAFFYTDSSASCYIKFGNSTTNIGSSEGCYVGYSGAEEFIIQNHQNSDMSFWTNGSTRGRFDADGGFVVGSPTGGSKGAGTINASGVYDDDTLLTDYVFDKYYDGKVQEEDEELHNDYEHISFAMTAAFAQINRHLPTMVGRKEWNDSGKKSIGDLLSQLWLTVETQHLHMLEMFERIVELEKGEALA